MHALAPIAYIADMKSPLFRTLVLFLDFFTVFKNYVFFPELIVLNKNLLLLGCHTNAKNN